MDIGDKQIPDTRLPELVSVVKTLYGKFGEKDVDHDTAASLLGHTTSRSGAYRQKIADLRSFGLIEGRGNVKVSETGRKLSYPNAPGEENQGLVEAIARVDLWKNFFDKYTAKGLELPSDTWVDLRTWTGLAPEIARDKSESIRKAYYQDIKYYRPTGIQPTESPTSTITTSDIRVENHNVPSPSEFDELRLGEIHVRLPKNGDLKATARKAIALISLHTGVEVAFPDSEKKNK